MNPSLKKFLAVVGVSGAVLVLSGIVLGGHDKELAAKADSFDLPNDQLDAPLFAESDDPVMAGAKGPNSLTDGGSKAPLDGPAAAPTAPAKAKTAAAAPKAAGKAAKGKAHKGKAKKGKKVQRRLAKKKAGKGRKTAHRKTKHAKAQASAQTAQNPA